MGSTIPNTGAVDVCSFFQFCLSLAAFPEGLVLQKRKLRLGPQIKHQNIASLRQKNFRKVKSET
jgi:hypothetical protein